MCAHTHNLSLSLTHTHTHTHHRQLERQLLNWVRTSQPLQAKDKHTHTHTQTHTLKQLWTETKNWTVYESQAYHLSMYLVVFELYLNVKEINSWLMYLCLEFRLQQSSAGFQLAVHLGEDGTWHQNMLMIFFEWTKFERHFCWNKLVKRLFFTILFTDTQLFTNYTHWQIIVIVCGCFQSCWTQCQPWITNQPFFFF